MKFQLMLANVMSRFMGIFKIEDTQYGEGTPAFVKNILAPILTVLNWLLPVVMILLGFVGVIYGIILGLKYAKSETADQKDAAKKRLINFVVGILIAIVAVMLMFLFIKFMPNIFGWAASGGTTEGTW